MTSHVEVAADLRHAPRASGPLGDQGGDCGRRSSGWRGGGGDRPCGLGALFEARPTAAPTRLPQCSRNVWLPAFADPYSGAALRILLLEDEPEMVSALRTALRRYDTIVDHVATLAEAEEALAIGAYGAVLLDRQVPDGDGLSLIRKLRARGLGVPIIVLTARGDVDERISGLDTGADDYLAKPFAMDELLARLRAVMRRPKGMQSHVLNFGRLSF